MPRSHTPRYLRRCPDVAFVLYLPLLFFLLCFLHSFNPFFCFCLYSLLLAAPFLLLLCVLARHALDACTIRVDQGTMLGKGHYGVVFRGTLAGGAGTRDVAVKMLPQDRAVEEAERQDFWEEVKFLRTLQLKGGHPHIIDFVGYVAGDSMMLVLAFAPRGSLLGFLREQPRGLLLGRLLEEPLALRFAHQIASGMAFIAANRMVHRDLAARNVLLSDTLDCNITDFGLARDVYTAGQYAKTSTPLC